jgi:hypothetical protein
VSGTLFDKCLPAATAVSAPDLRLIDIDPIERFPAIGTTVWPCTMILPNDLVEKSPRIHIK